MTVGNLVFLSGHGPTRDGKLAFQGKVGAERTVEEGYRGRQTGDAELPRLAQGGDWRPGPGRADRQAAGHGQLHRGFRAASEVINGASDLLVELFGERGRHARSAVGMQALPKEITVEIEMIVQIQDA